MNYENPAFNGRPLLSFMLVAYNQEEFIREAVEGALSQSYSPLEIILSDDCSPDRTFEIIEEMAANYKGPHEIILNRNSCNLGLSAHVDRALKLCSGELLVAAAGDDISMPHRVESLYKAWEEHDRPSMICSGWSGIDEDGNECSILHKKSPEKTFDPGKNNLKAIQSYLDGRTFLLLGSTAAYSRELIDFREIDAGIPSEDFFLCLRSYLLNGVLSIEDSLVLYRWHGNNLSGGSEPPVERFRRWSVMNAENLKSFYRDLKRSLECDSPMSLDDFERLETKVNAWLRSTSIMEKWNQSGLLMRMFWLVPRLLWIGSVRHKRFATNYVIRTLKSKLGYAFWKKMATGALQTSRSLINVVD